MPRIILEPDAPGTDAWQKKITASKIPPMLTDPDDPEQFLGLGYQSAAALYDQMTGQAAKHHHDADTLELFAHGHAMELSAQEMWQNRNPEWTLNDPHPNGHGGHTREVQYADVIDPVTGHEAFATLDAVATHTDGTKAVLECKAPMRFGGLEQGWRVQHNAQMAVSGIHTGWIIVVPHFGEPEFIRHDYEPGLWAHTVNCINQFMARIQWGNRPEETDPSRLLDHLAETHADYDRQSVVDLDTYRDKITEWYDAEAAYKEAETARNMARAQVGELLGDNQAGRWNGKTIVRRQAGKFSKARYPNPDVLESDEVRRTTTVLDTDKLQARDPEAYQQALGPGTYVFLPKMFTEQEQS